MSADTLREAAALMRARAKVAADAPWYSREEVATLPGWPDNTYIRWSVYATDTYDKGNTPYVAEANGRQDAEHIASWHPAAALAVADWLDLVAEDCEYDDSPAYVNAATTVATAYLNPQSARPDATP